MAKAIGVLLVFMPRLCGEGRHSQLQPQPTYVCAVCHTKRQKAKEASRVPGTVQNTCPTTMDTVTGMGSLSCKDWLSTANLLYANLKQGRGETGASVWRINANR